MIRFLFVGEGSSDEALVPHLEELCIECGAKEVSGTAPDLRWYQGTQGHSVESKVSASLRLEPDIDLIFIHRDADGKDPQPRYREIAEAVEEFDIPYVAIVPVQMTEAWLLLNEEAMRFAVGNPNGRSPLNTPPPHRVEQVSDPKKRLRDLLIIACELHGRNLDRFKRKLPKVKRRLIEQLPTGGPLEHVRSWRRLREDTCETLAEFM